MTESEHIGKLQSYRIAWHADTVAAAHNMSTKWSTTVGGRNINVLTVHMEREPALPE
jgi:hypothetical protein